jgi:hypothetical protein
VSESEKERIIFSFSLSLSKNHEKEKRRKKIFSLFSECCFYANIIIYLTILTPFCLAFVGSAVAGT